jgi:drug/metabolite transporter (DMT)-like permease
LIAAGIWGGMYVVSKVVLHVIPPFALLTLRLMLGGLLLGCILAWRGQLRVGWSLVRQSMGAGTIGFGISLALQFVGTRLSTASNAALVTSASPAFMMVFAALLLREHIGGRRILALVLATSGELAVIDPGTAQLAPGLFWGNVALLGAALTWGLYSVLIKAVNRRATILQVGFYGFIGGLLVAVPAAWAEARLEPIGRIDWPIVLGVLYLGLISTALAFVLWAKSLALLDVGVVSLLFFAQPLVGIGLATVLLGDRLGLSFWSGAGMIGLGLLLSLGQAAPESPEMLSPAPASRSDGEEDSP